MKPGDPVRIEYIRPGKEITYYEEDLVSLDEHRLRTFKTLPPDISEHLSRALQKQEMILPGQQVLTIGKTYFFAEPFNLLQFRGVDGELLGYYSDIGEPTIQLEEHTFQMIDLFLDIWLFPDGRLLELDWDEFLDAMERQIIAPAQAELAREAMKRLVAEVEQGIYPSKYL
jgi:predicted RNA-binding protein associated with RNAse of E/G family